MIKIEVKPYCGRCTEFEADTQDLTIIYANQSIVEQIDTIVKCKHRVRCAYIVEFIKGELKGD